MDLVHEVTLDVTVDGETEEEVETAVAAWLEEEKLLGPDLPIVAKVMHLRGPGGAWPVVRFRTPKWGVMLRLLYAYHDDNIDEAVEAYDEWVKITL